MKSTINLILLLLVVCIQSQNLNKQTPQTSQHQNDQQILQQPMQQPTRTIKHKPNQKTTKITSLKTHHRNLIDCSTINNCSQCQYNASLSTSIICNKCSSSFRLNALKNICEPCTAQNCQKCQFNPNICQSCLSKFYFDKVTLKCQACSYKCLTCTSYDPLDCKFCQAPYIVATSSSAVTVNKTGCSLCQVKNCNQCDSNNNSLCVSCGNMSGQLSLFDNKCLFINQTSNGYATLITLQNDNPSTIYSVKCPPNCQNCGYLPGATVSNRQSYTKCFSCFKGYYLTNGICIKCSSNCLYCSLSDSLFNYECFKCPPGNKLAFNDDDCHACQIPNCQQCQGYLSLTGSQQNCLRCADSYYFDGKKTCLKCPQYCKKCKNNTFCLQVEEKYTFVQNYDNNKSNLTNNIAQCPNECYSCTISFSEQKIKCFSCYPGHYLNQNFTCQPCLNTKCQVCATSTNCNKCKHGYKLINNNCFWEKQNKYCWKFSNNTGECLECFFGYSLDTSSNICLYNQTISKSAIRDYICPKGQYLQGFKCLNCSNLENCLQCKQNKCLQCELGYFPMNSICKKLIKPNCIKYNYDGYCQNCEVGYFVSIKNYNYNQKYQDKNVQLQGEFLGQCLKCSKNCKTCSFKQNYCTSCYQTFNLTTSKTCVGKYRLQFKILYKNFDSYQNINSIKLIQSLSEFIVDDLPIHEKKNSVFVDKVVFPNSSSLYLKGLLIGNVNNVQPVIEGSIYLSSQKVKIQTYTNFTGNKGSLKYSQLLTSFVISNSTSNPPTTQQILNQQLHLQKAKTKQLNLMIQQKQKSLSQKQTKISQQQKTIQNNNKKIIQQQKTIADLKATQLSTTNDNNMKQSLSEKVDKVEDNAEKIVYGAIGGMIGGVIITLVLRYLIVNIWCEKQTKLQNKCKNSINPQLIEQKSSQTINQQKQQKPKKQRGILAFLSSSSQNKSSKSSQSTLNILKKQFIKYQSQKSKMKKQQSKIKQQKQQNDNIFQCKNQQSNSQIKQQHSSQSQQQSQYPQTKSQLKLDTNNNNNKSLQFIKNTIISHQQQQKQQNNQSIQQKQFNIQASINKNITNKIINKSFQQINTHIQNINHNDINIEIIKKKQQLQQKQQYKENKIMEIQE